MRSNLGSLASFSGVSLEFPERPETFKQVQVELEMNISCNDPGIGKVLHVNAGVKILKTYIVATPRSVSYEGQVMTGLMLVVEGQVEEDIRYMADDFGESIRTACFMKLFSTFIVLDKRFASDSDVTVTPYIEDIYTRQTGERSLYGRVLLLLDAVPLMT